VLVDGDDMNEPIADTVRGILDGHFVMERQLAERGQYPAINVLKSISRVMKQIASPEHLENSSQIRSLMATYEQNRELIQISAHKRGTDLDIDKAITYNANIQRLLKQAVYESYTIYQSITEMEGLLTGGKVV